MVMKKHRITELFGGAAAAALAVGAADIAQAQDSSGGSIDLGGNIASTVTNAVSDISTGSSSGGGTVTGGVQTESNSLDFGEDEGVAISDASGGNNNISFVS
jgi:hypothetical protein